jgi:kynurenine formamidase
MEAGMCAPSVIEAVKNDFSRRGFLAAVGGAVAALAPEPLLAQAKPVRLANGFRTVYDLTHTFSPQIPVFPAFKPVQIRQRFTIAKDGFFANEITFDEHTGTHLDAPIHFVADRPSADRLAPDRFFAPLAVVSIETRAAKDSDAVVTVDDVLAWERRHGRLPSGAFVAMHSGWDARIGDANRFLNKDAQGTMHAPGFSEEAARFLAQERDIVGAGVDTLSLDVASAQKFVAHLALLGAGKYAVELMANLATVPPSGATLIVGGPKHQGASGGPVRVFAVV